MRSIKRIVKIHGVNGYKVYCLFNNGESRIIDFEVLFEKWNIKQGHVAYPLTRDVKAFQKLKLSDGSLVWEDLTFTSTDDEGNEVTHCFDVDPIVLYENSEPDKNRTLKIGEMIKKARKEQGLTQQELADKSGTSKHYISRIENDKSGIELMTLKKIVEGLGKNLKVTIEG